MQSITVRTAIDAPREDVWRYWTDPEHITEWNAASDDWHTTRAENDLRVGGSFSSRMEARDGSAGFDFMGTYDTVERNERIAYTMEDGRKVRITFAEINGRTAVEETFDAEQENSIEMQREGWQAILDNFKRYVQTR